MERPLAYPSGRPAMGQIGPPLLRNGLRPFAPRSTHLKAFCNSATENASGGSALGRASLAVPQSSPWLTNFALAQAAGSVTRIYSYICWVLSESIHVHSRCIGHAIHQSSEHKDEKGQPGDLRLFRLGSCATYYCAGNER